MTTTKTQATTATTSEAFPPETPYELLILALDWLKMLEGQVKELNAEVTSIQSVLVDGIRACKRAGIEPVDKEEDNRSRAYAESRGEVYP